MQPLAREADEMASCNPRTWTRPAFEHLRELHFRECNPHTPVVRHELMHAGLGNAIGQLVLALHLPRSTIARS